MARVPVLIVGPPGSSKTLSFNIVVNNCHGQESKHDELKDCDIFKCLDPHPYQCSRKSTSTEIETVFKRATNRQQTIDQTRKQAVVMMDEAGLPEDSHESLKALHYLLDEDTIVSLCVHVCDGTNKTCNLLYIYTLWQGIDEVILHRFHLLVFLMKFWMLLRLTELSLFTELKCLHKIWFSLPNIP